MKLRTNYKTNDWIRFIITLSLYVIISSSSILIIIQYCLIPTIQTVGFVAKFLNEDGNEEWQKYVDSWIKQNRSKQQAESIIISAIVSSFIIPAVLLFGFSFIITKAVQLPFFLCKKLHISPQMDLVVIKNERFWFKMRF